MRYKYYLIIEFLCLHKHTDIYIYIVETFVKYVNHPTLELVEAV